MIECNQKSKSRSSEIESNAPIIKNDSLDSFMMKE